MRALLPDYLVSASASKDEFVVPFAESLEAMDALEKGGGRLLGWEGWLRRADGSLGHSSNHQGTVDLARMSRESAFALCRKTIIEAHSEHARVPEVDGGELLFCITYDA
jgi:hypothetical protein